MQPLKADVAILGAGIVGSAIAYYLAEAGKRVVVFEADRIGGGASGRNSGAFEHPYDEAQSELYARSLGLLQDVGVDLPEEIAGVLLLAESAEAAHRCASVMAGFDGLAPRVVAPDELVALEPGLSGGLWGCEVRTGRPVEPEAATRTYASGAMDLGAEFIEGVRAEPIVDGERCAGVRTADGELLVDTVIVATGAASSRVIDPTGAWAPINPAWGVSIEVRGLASVPKRILLDAQVAASQTGAAEEAKDFAFSLITAGGRTVVGSTFLPDAPPAAAWTPRLLENAARFVPGVAHATPGRIWVCARPRSVDGRPLLGPLGEGLWLAAGHGGRGITTGAASARLVVDALLEGSERRIPEPLRAARFPLRLLATPAATR